MKTKTYENYLNEYIVSVNELYTYNTASNLIYNDKFDPKKTVKMGKKVGKLARELINLDIEKFMLLLDNDNIYVRENVAEYLYPFFPKKCLAIMEEYADTFDKDVDKITINSKIRGLKRGETFFSNLYKDIYKTDDLNKLNRETKK